MIESQQLAALKKEITSYLANNSGQNAYAAFDADGTLWDMDMSEAFFTFQIKKQIIKGLPADPFGHYKKMHDKNPRQAYLWLAQVNKGLPLQTLQSLATEFIAELKNPYVFSIQKELIAFLKSKDVTIYIVTASVKWAVEPGAQKYYGLEADRVIGVATKVVDGIITDQQDGPITWREGKVEGLLQKTHQSKAFICSGNTLGDLPLLKSASHIKWVVTAAKKDSHLWTTEQALLTEAKNNSWLYLENPATL